MYLIIMKAHHIPLNYIWNISLNKVKGGPISKCKWMRNAKKKNGLHQHGFELQNVSPVLLSSSLSWPYLNDDEQANSRSHLWGVTIHASHHVNNSLPNGDDHSKHWNTLKRINHLSWIQSPCENKSIVRFLVFVYISALHWRGLCLWGCLQLRWF